MVRISILIMLILLGSRAWGQGGDAIDLRAHFMVRGSVEVLAMLPPPDRSLPIELQGMSVCPCPDGFLLMKDRGQWAWVSSDLQSSQVYSLTAPSGPNRLPFYQALCVPGQGIFASSLGLQATKEKPSIIPGPIPQIWIRCGDKKAVDISSVLPVGDRTVDHWGVPWPIRPAYWDAYGVWFSIGGRWYEWDLNQNRLDEAEWMNAWLRQHPPAPRPPKGEPRGSIWKAIQRFIIAQAEVLSPSRYAVQAWEWSNRQWVRTCDLQVPLPVIPAQARLVDAQPNFLSITGDRKDQVVLVYRMEGRPLDMPFDVPKEPETRVLSFMSFLDVYDLQSCQWVARNQYIIPGRSRPSAVSLRMVSGDLWITNFPHIFRLKVLPEAVPPSQPTP